MPEMTGQQQQLLTAIKQQSLEGVKAALALGADPNAYDGEGKSMLGRHGNQAGLLLECERPSWLGILEALLVAGADPNLPSDQRFGEYLLHSLSQHSLLPAMRLMLDHGADPNRICEGDTALDVLVLDYSYEETCNLPAWYKGRVLPEYQAAEHDLEDDGNRAIWLVSRHQRGWAMLRQTGGLKAWELRQGPITGDLGLYADVLGGLFTRYARPDAGFMASLGGALCERIARWARDYQLPDLLGYEARAVREFDYAAHLREGMAIGAAIAPFLPEGTKMDIAMPTRESIAAACTLSDHYEWNRDSQSWEKTLDWRAHLSPEWFGPEPAGRLRPVALVQERRA